jgi:glucose/arabinose dehydrogenase
MSKYRILRARLTNVGLVTGLFTSVPLCLIGVVSCARSQQAAAKRPTPAQTAALQNPEAHRVLTGADALGDWTTDAPGVRRKITLNDLPAPYATPSVDRGPRIVRRPDGAALKVPAGFEVQEYATALNNPRQLTTAPNGDIFVVESDPGQVRILRPGKGANAAPTVDVFATGLVKPFGIAFYPPGPNPQYLYIGNTDSVVRFPYRNGDMKARGAAETLVDNIPGGGRLRGGGHWTRDVKFSKDGRQMFVSVGSLTNVHEKIVDETRRANILAFTPEGKNERIYASGIRNAVGLAVHPVTGQLWCSVNERDGLGDHLVPDYITHVTEGGFYGWPWFYMGGHPDERAQEQRPELGSKVITPDVLVQSHMASLGMTFYTGTQFPKEYSLEGFAAEHGSWNRERRTGYKVIRVPMQNNAATGAYEDFVTGFVTPDGEVWGRPVGVTVARDGALLFTDDVGNKVWRVAYTGAKRQTATR